MDSLPNIVNAESLTAALRRSGRIGPGRVSAVAVETSWSKQRSHTYRLLLSFDGQACDAPRTLIVKTGHPGEGGRPAFANAREVAFYRDVAPGRSRRLTPLCFEAVDAEGDRRWHLVLEDLTETHRIATEYPLPPDQASCEMIVAAWARFHADGWGCRLAPSPVRWPEAAWTDYLGVFPDQFARFLDRHGQVISPERRDLVTRLVDRLPRLLARYGDRRSLTLVHGDAHPWNCFLPRRGGVEDVRFFDWESWGVDTGTTDLAYLMAMLWYPDLRRRLERPLLDRYHAELSGHGVSDYGRRALADDYRLSVLLLVLRPLRQAAFGIPARVWWPNLERIALAIDDLDCRELLG